VIDPRRLRVLRALADHGTVTAAADALYLTPSAVSQQLTALESEVGQPLLRRRGRTVSLTAAGEVLLHHTHTILAELDRAEAALAELATGTVGEVTVAAFATAITLVVAPAAAALRESTPGLCLVVQDAEGDRSLPLLLDGAIDVAVAVEYRGAPRADDERLIRLPLYSEPFDAVLAATHPLAGEGQVAVAQLADDDWISPSVGNPVRDVVDLACEQAGFHPRIRHCSDDFSAVAALAGAGVGVALVPRLVLRGAIAPGAVARPVVAPTPHRHVFAAVRRGREDHPLLKATLDELAAIGAAISG
jgi:DNA-binding transcriptional LysR family regulator